MWLGVRMRVLKGGHSVPKAKIISRYHRSLAEMPWFLEQADYAWLFDNTGEEPRLIGRKSDGVVTLDESAPGSIIAAVRSIQTE
jgi:predicted ABC-type ATPase